MSFLMYVIHGIIYYLLFVVLGGIMVICNLYRNYKDRIKKFKSMYPGKSKNEYYQMALKEFKNNSERDYDKVYEETLIIFVPLFNIILTVILFIDCLIEYFIKYSSKLKIWGNFGEKYKRLYFWINKKMIEINLKGE